MEKLLILWALFGLEGVVLGVRGITWNRPEFWVQLGILIAVYFAGRSSD